MAQVLLQPRRLQLRRSGHHSRRRPHTRLEDDARPPARPLSRRVGPLPRSSHEVTGIVIDCRDILRNAPPSQSVNTSGQSVHEFRRGVCPPPPRATDPAHGSLHPPSAAGPPGVPARRGRVSRTPGDWPADRRDRHRPATRSSGPLARFSLVLKRAASRVARRTIGGADAEWSAAERSALDAGRGSTTPAKKRVAQRPPAHLGDRSHPDVSPGAPRRSSGGACPYCRSATDGASASPRGPRPSPS